MTIFSDPSVAIAETVDIPAVVKLLNSAYRGESSKKGWTTEAGLIAGEVRTDADGVQSVMQQPGSVFLKYVDAEGKLIGCVNLQLNGNKIYLGMFSVDPDLQGGGVGKQLMIAAEAYARSVQAIAIYMSVISVRKELIAWYERRGYQDTGARKDFVEDGITGKHLQPLVFMTMEKTL